MPISTDKDRVRLLISDVGGNSGTDFLFSDNEIETFLDHRGGDVARAAATALRTMAANEALVAKRIKFLELETDGPATAKALRELASEIESQQDDDADIDVIEMETDFFATRRLRGIP